MKYILIFLTILITVQVNAQKTINTSPFTNASGDLRGTYPSPRIGVGKVASVNITTGLRDSIQRFRKDTTIQVVNTTLNMASQANLYGKFNRVYVFANTHSSNTANIVLPAGADTLKNTEFVIRHLGSDTTSYTCQVYSFDGFASAYSPAGYVTDVSISLKSRRALFTKPFKVGSDWYYEQSIVNYSYSAIAADALGITALTGDVVATGNGSVAATISALAVTSGKLANLAVTTGKLANAGVTLAKMANDAVNSATVVDYSLTGSDLNYLSLRAGDASNAILRFNSGTDKSSLGGGEWLFNGTRLGFAISSTVKRIPLTNDVAPTAGQIPIGNGTDYTVATLTAGSNIAITNSSGAISIATYPKRDTLIYLNNVDYNLGTALTSTEVNRRHTKIVINSYLSSSASSDNQLTMPVPGANYELCEIQYYSYDESGDADDATITFGTNLGVLGNGSYTSSYDLTAGQMVTIRCMKDVKDSNNYKWFFW